MKFLDEYRNAGDIQIIVEKIHNTIKNPWTIMEICGGQTHTIVKHGLQQLLPESLELVHGPGCPVCVTPQSKIDAAIEIASDPQVIFCSFGDMLRVPGTTTDLLAVKAAGGDVRTVYSPLDAIKIAEQHEDKEVVFFAIGFETTAPGNAMAAKLADHKGLRNFSLLVSHFLVPPAIEYLCSQPGNRVQGFLAAGHVCAIMGYDQYQPLAQQFQMPLVVTGFEPLDILLGIQQTIQMLEQGDYSVKNAYSRVVSNEGNSHAQQAITDVFDVTDQQWRGIGSIPASGLVLRPDYSHLDALNRFTPQILTHTDNRGCISGDILQGLKKPVDCPHFSHACQPQSPLGAPMVSSEGACAAYYRYMNRFM